MIIGDRRDVGDGAENTAVPVSLRLVMCTQEVEVGVLPEGWIELHVGELDARMEDHDVCRRGGDFPARQPDGSDLIAHQHLELACRIAISVLDHRSVSSVVGLQLSNLNDPYTERCNQVSIGEGVERSYGRSHFRVYCCLKKNILT